MGLFSSFLVWIIFGAAVVGPVLDAGIHLPPIVYAVISLTVVRMVPVALSLTRDHLRRDTIGFVGWFGPRGLASVVFTLLAFDALRGPRRGPVARRGHDLDHPAVGPGSRPQLGAPRGLVRPASRRCPSRHARAGPRAPGPAAPTEASSDIAGVLVLLMTIQPTLANVGFAVGMGVLGIGMGLMISQLGNVIQSSVEESGRSEAGGLQFTGQQLGSSLGVAFIGSIVLIGLSSAFLSNVADDPRISDEISTQVGVAAGNGTNFVSSTEIEAAANDAGLDEATTAALVDDYETAQLRSLKAGLLGAAILALISLAFTRELPHKAPRPQKKPEPATAS